MFVASRAHGWAPAAITAPPSRAQMSLYSRIVFHERANRFVGNGRPCPSWSRNEAPMPSVRLQIRSSRIVGRALSPSTRRSASPTGAEVEPAVTTRPGPGFTAHACRRDEARARSRLGGSAEPPSAPERHAEPHPPSAAETADPAAHQCARTAPEGSSLTRGGSSTRADLPQQGIGGERLLEDWLSGSRAS